MEKIVTTVSSIPKSKSRKDDDFIDRLSHRYTTIILVAFALLVTLQTYVGSAITCWAPVQFTDSHKKYTNSFCWVRNTYYVPFNERLPKPGEPRTHVIPYYQWVPFILLIQAVFFWLPSIVWHGLNQKGGVDCDNILTSAGALTDAKAIDRRKRVLKIISNQMHRFLSNRLKRQPVGCHCSVESIVKLLCQPFGRRLGNYLVLLFIVTKFLYLGNIVAQLFVLNKVLSTSYNVYGFWVLDYLLSDKDWTQSPDVAFPRVTFCDMNIRRLGNLHTYTIQCTLPINMYTEKIYMFLWFWMFVLSLITAVGIVVWTSRSCMRSDRVRFIKNHLTMAGRFDGPPDMAALNAFIDDYLAQDGAFVLRLIAHNTNSLTVTDITAALWDCFLKYQKEKEEKQQRLGPDRSPPPVNDKGAYPLLGPYEKKDM